MKKYFPFLLISGLMFFLLGGLSVALFVVPEMTQNEQAFSTIGNQQGNVVPVGGLILSGSEISADVSDLKLK